jgi:phage tail-like protein
MTTPAENTSAEDNLEPLGIFRFRVDFFEDGLVTATDNRVPLCSGSFSECSGLDATMEPKVIKEGGLNYGANQRVGPVTFGTVVLKRGMTSTRDLWSWFSVVTKGGGYAYRLRVEITMQRTQAGATPGAAQVANVVKLSLAHALPVKFRSADLNATGTTLAIEELHLAHEGLTVVNA